VGNRGFDYELFAKACVCLCMYKAWGLGLSSSLIERFSSCVYGCLCVLMKAPLEYQLPEPIRLSPNQP